MGKWLMLLKASQVSEHVIKPYIGSDFAASFQVTLGIGQPLHFVAALP